MSFRYMACWTATLTALLLMSYVGFRGVEHIYAKEVARVSRFRTVGVLFGPIDRVVPLTPGVAVSQTFRSSLDQLVAIRVESVAWVHPSQRLNGHWALYELDAGGTSKNLVRQGTYRVNGSLSFPPLKLQFPPLSASRGRDYELVLHDPEASPTGRIGLSLFQTYPRKETLQTLQLKVIDLHGEPQSSGMTGYEISGSDLSMNMKLYHWRPEN